MVSQAAPSSYDFITTERQDEALRYLAAPEDTEVMYGGAKGGGKSFFGCAWCFLQARDIAKSLGIKKRKNPIPVGFMGRKIAKNFRETTLETWKKFIPQNAYEIKNNGAEIVIDGAVKILIGGLDHTETVNKFNSSELFFFFIDQAEETTRQDIAVLRGALRATFNGKRVAYKGLFTANPAQCWLKEEFIDNPQPNRKFVQALPSDNPYLPDSYTKTLTDAFGFRPELLAAYLHGDWNQSDMPNQVIQSRWIEQAKKTSRIQDTGTRFVVCDPARFGDDEAVALLMESAQIIGHKVMPFCNTKQLSFELARMSKENNNCCVVVESTGGDIGAGVIDELRSLGIEVIVFCPNGSSVKPDEFYNARAEAWWGAAKLLSEGRVRINPDYDRPFMTKLESQLCSLTYEFRNGKILIESKEDLKKRIGCSPDRADALVIGLWALDKVHRNAVHRAYPDQIQKEQREYDPLEVYR